MKSALVLMLLALFSCNQIETGDSISNADKQFIESMGLLEKGEFIHKFYSEFKKRNAGNFFTDKRIATYWIDERNKDKNEISFAFYPEIESIDTIYNAGATYSPYMLVKKKNGAEFKVSVNGKKNDIQSFFEDALAHWRNHK
jgi:hypothetical protein